MKQSLAVFVTICLLASTIPLGAQQPATPSTPPTTDRAAAEAVRRDVDSWGVGKKIEVRTVIGTRLRGTIQSIEADAFEIRHGRKGVADRVRYDDVSHIRKAGLSTGAGIAIIGGIVGGLIFLQWFNDAVSQS